MFSQDEIQQLLEIIDKNTNIFIAQNIGKDYLTKDEILKLEKVGIDTNKLYLPDGDIVKQSFQFGLISDALGPDANKINFSELKDYFKGGNYIPLTKVEQFSIDSIKKQSLNDIRANKNRIFNDINNIISSKEKNNRVAYENVIRKEVETGFIKQKTVGEISRELGKVTGDWSRNFTKSVEYISHSAFNEGRVAAIERKDENAKVYFDVYPGACRVCIKVYLTNGTGSKPLLFTLKEIKENGSNIGRKVKDWKATLSPTHVFCRCTVNHFKEGKIWNEKTKRFELSNEIVIKDRLPIKFTVKIGKEEKNYFV